MDHADDAAAADADQAWDAAGYEDDFAYVHEYGGAVVDLLDPS